MINHMTHKPVDARAKNALGVMCCVHSKKIKKATDSAKSAVNTLKEISDGLKEAGNELTKALDSRPREDINRWKRVKDALNSMINAIDRAIAFIGSSDMKNAIDGTNDITDVLYIATSEGVHAISKEEADKLKEAVNKAEYATDKVKEAIYSDKVKEAIYSMAEVIDNLNRAAGSMKDAAKKMKKIAAKLFDAAASKRLPAAQYNLALMCAKDNDLVKDNREIAVKLYKKAASYGDADAQNHLAWMYYNGEGTPEDMEQEARLKEAMKWYEKAANQGLAGAQYSLGVMYYNGEGTPEADREKADELFRIAAKKHAIAKLVVEWLERGLPTSDNFIRVVAPEDEWLERKSVELLLKEAAKQRFADAQYCLGLLRENSTGLKFEDYLHRSTVQKKSKSDTVLTSEGEKYGLTTNQSQQQEPSHDGSDTGAHESVAQNASESVSLWHYYKAATRGHVAAQRKIREKAYGKTDKIEHICCMAQNYLGEMYAYGKGVTRDMKEAYFWLWLAKKNAEDSAKNADDVEGSEDKKIREDLCVEIGKKFRRVERDLKSSDQFKNAEKKAASRHEKLKDWKDEIERKAWAKDLDAQRKLAFSYRDGKGVIEDLYEAYVWFLVAEKLCGDEDEKALNAKEQIEEGFMEDEIRRAEKEAERRRGRIDNG